MRIFEHFPEEFTCRICGKNTDKQCALAGIGGTEEGNNIQAIPIHLDCIDLLYYPENKKGHKRAFLAQVINGGDIE